MPIKKQEYPPRLSTRELSDLHRRGYAVRDLLYRREHNSASAGGCLVLIALLATIYFGYRRFVASPAPAPSYSQLISALDHTQGTLNQLLRLVDSQKVELQSRELAVADLNRQIADLRTILETDKKAVAAILEADAKRRAADVWFERAYSFLAGVVSSLLATWLYGRFGRRRPAVESNAPSNSP